MGASGGLFGLGLAINPPNYQEAPKSLGRVRANTAGIAANPMASGVRDTDALYANQAQGLANDAFNQQLAARGQQSALAQSIRGAMGGPSAAGTRSGAAQAQAARQAMASGVGGGLLGARGSMMMQGQGSLAAAAQGANQRVSEQARMQRELGAALQGMRGQDLAAMSSAQNQQMALRGLGQQYAIGRSDLQKRQQLMNQELREGEFARKQRAALAEFGAFDREKQAAQQRRAQTDAAIAAGLEAAGTGLAAAVSSSGSDDSSDGWNYNTKQVG